MHSPLHPLRLSPACASLRGHLSVRLVRIGLAEGQLYQQQCCSHLIARLCTSAQALYPAEASYSLPPQHSKSDICRDAAAHAGMAGGVRLGAWVGGKEVLPSQQDLCRAGGGKRMHCRHSCFLLPRASTDEPIWGRRRHCYPSAQACSEARLLQLRSCHCCLQAVRRLKTACIAHLPECC